MNYNEYIKSNFSSSEIKKPLFYNVGYGLRFEIGDPKTNIWKDNSHKILNTKYFNDALNRAIILIENTFNKNDKIYFLCQKPSAGRQKINKNNYCFKNIESYYKIENFKIRSIYEDEEYEDRPKKIHWHRIIFHTSFDKINYSNILKKTVYIDFGSNAVETYFINIDKNIIFHFYDDRGLDIIAKDPYTLKGLYQRYNDWLLDYDREKMDSVFKNLK